ncbi:MAG: alpha/beta hydrolase [Bacteroidia bacterium]|nr:alpha/beta hydrolase [Bacteroidia bacterium]
MEIQVGDDYWKFDLKGQGHHLLIALHGYGQDATAFRYLTPGFEDQYTIVLVDLAYHGQQANMRAGLLFNKAYAQLWLETLLRALNKRKAGLLGFSIGARVALFIASVAPMHIRELWLIAPDGLPVSPIYRFLTSTKPGVLLFSSFVEKPWLARFLVRTGLLIRLLNQQTGNYFLKEIETKTRRQHLFNTWSCYRLALPEFSALSQLNTDGRLSVFAILGTRDAIIPFKKTKRALKRVLPQAILLAPELGHNLLSEKASRILQELIRHKKSDQKPLKQTLDTD